MMIRPVSRNRLKMDFLYSDKFGYLALIFVSIMISHCLWYWFLCTAITQRIGNGNIGQNTKNNLINSL